MDQLCVRGVHAYAYAVTPRPTPQAPPGRAQPARTSLAATQGCPRPRYRAPENKCQRMQCGRCASMRCGRCAAMRCGPIPATVTAGAAARSRTAAVEPLPSAAKAVRVGPAPASVRSGRLGCPRLPGSSARDALRRRKRNPYACGRAVSECIRARDGEDARPAQCGGGESELVGVSQQ